MDYKDLVAIAGLIALAVYWAEKKPSFLRQKYVLLSLFAVAVLTSVHLVYEYFTTWTPWSHFSWNYLLDFLFEPETNYKHAPLEFAVFGVAVWLRHFGLKLRKELPREVVRSVVSDVIARYAEKKGRL